MGQRPTPTLLRLIAGESAKHPERVRTDRPKTAAPPALPVGTVLSPAERATWDWLVETIYMPGLHSPGDGPAFLKVARLLTRVNQIDRKLHSQGCLMRHPKTNKPSVSPNAKLSREIWSMLGPALDAIGASPSGRYRFAPPHGKGHDASSWDDFD